MYYLKVERTNFSRTLILMKIVQLTGPPPPLFGGDVDRTLSGDYLQTYLYISPLEHTLLEEQQQDPLTIVEDVCSS